MKWNNLFSTLAISTALLITSSAAQAQLTTSATSIQLESDVRVALKQIYKLQAAYYAEWGQYATTLSTLNYSVPSFLSGYVKTTISTTGSNLTVQMQGIASPVLNRYYSINATGTLSGVTQYDNAHELESEIWSWVQATETAEAAYHAEWGAYSSNLSEIGILVPPYLTRYGSLKVTLVGSGYKIEFLGSAYPISGKVYLKQK